MTMIDRARSWLRAALLQTTKPASGRVITGNGLAGVRVDHDIALTYSAVWACVQVISQTIGVLGWHVFERERNGKKVKRDDLLLDWIIDQQPNTEMSAQVFRETLTAHCLLWGNAYAEIVFDNAGRVSQLWPLLPDRMRPVRDASGKLYYEYYTGATNAANRGIVPLEARNVLHLRGLGFDGVVGYDVISYQAMSMGMGIANERYASAFFRNGAHLSIGLVTDKALDKKARENIREAFKETYARGPGEAFQIGVFGDGVKPHEFSVSPEASQLVENRKFAITDIARIFRVPPHMIADLDKSAFSNIEQQSIDFTQHTILPWVTRWEQEANIKLIGARNSRLYTKLNLMTLQRGDIKSRYEAYQIGRQNGWLNANTILALEDMDPIPGIAGEAYIVPLNFQLADKLDEEPPAPAAPPGATPPAEPSGDTPPEPSPTAPGKTNAPADRGMSRLGPLVAKVADRIIAREHNALGKKAEVTAAVLAAWLPGHGEYVHDELVPVFIAMGLSEAGAFGAAGSIRELLDIAIADHWLGKEQPERDTCAAWLADKINTVALEALK